MLLSYKIFTKEQKMNKAEFKKQEMSDGLVILTQEQLKSLLLEVIQSHNCEPQQKEKFDSDVYLTNKEVQRILNISNTSVFEFIKKGKLKPIRFGRKLLFRKKDIILR